MLDSIKNELRILRNKKRYPKSVIESSSINKTAEIGSDSIIKKGASVANNAKIGSNCLITSNVLIGSDVSFGDYSYVNSDTRINSGIIGKFCSISYGCQIGMNEHPTNFISSSPFLYGPNNIFGVDPYFQENHTPPVIGNDVWIGSQAIILQGVKIGDGAIIAAGAVVNKDVPPYTIVGGVPAKFIKKRFDDAAINYLSNIKWWDMSIEDIRQMKETFLKKEKWVEDLPLLFKQVN